jgi:hypothetical protein
MLRFRPLKSVEYKFNLQPSVATNKCGFMPPRYSAIDLPIFLSGVPFAVVACVLRIYCDVFGSNAQDASFPPRNKTRQGQKAKLKRDSLGRSTPVEEYCDGGGSRNLSVD